MYVRAWMCVHDQTANTVACSHAGQAVVLGFIGAALSGLFLILLLICQFLGSKLRIAGNSLVLSCPLGTLLTPCLGGAILGSISYVLPMTGDASEMLKYVNAAHASAPDSPLLIAATFANILTLCVSLGFGFVGGVYQSRARSVPHAAARALAV